TVDAYSSLFADPEFQTAAATGALLLLQLRQASLQLFIGWFSHALPREIMMWWLHHRVSAPDSSRGMLRLRCFAFPRSGNLGLPSGSSSAVERQLPKLDVAGSIPVSRSINSSGEREGTPECPISRSQAYVHHADGGTRRATASSAGHGRAHVRRHGSLLHTYQQPSCQAGCRTARQWHSTLPCGENCGGDRARWELR